MNLPNCEDKRTALYTIGFTKTTAECFISRLKEARVRTLIDVRLKTDGQLSGFAKSVDLKYFLRDLASIDYKPLPIFAPTSDMLSAYRKRQINWDEYAELYLDLLKGRHLSNALNPLDFADACLLCSEATATRCHRRLAAEFIQESFKDVAAIEIVHI